MSSVGKAGAVVTMLGVLAGVVAAQEVALTSSNLPLVLIDTQGQTIPDEPKITARMQIIDNGPGLRNKLTDTPTGYDGWIGIEMRGRSSQYYYDKKQYGVETRDAAGEDLDVSLLGMPAEEDWILYAPYGDKSLLRNVLVYQLARDMGYWASRSHFCEVLIDGEYMGVFVLMEKIKQDSGRLDLDPPDPLDADCGFLVEMTPELFLDESNLYVTTDISGRHWEVAYPRDDDITPTQLTGIAAQLDGFESALYYGDREDWWPLIDPASVADYLLLNELTRNYDTFAASTWVYSDYGGVLHLGPVWDYNSGFGNIDYPPESADWETAGWSQAGKLWADVLMADGAFAGLLATNWSRRRADLLDDGRLDDWFAAQTALLDEAQARNFERWPILGQYVWPNYYVGDTWADEVAWLRQWIDDRAAWLDAQWLRELPTDPVINEINYASAVDFDPGDWVEIFNADLALLDLSGWHFRDEDDEHDFVLPAGTVLEAGGYLVLSADTTAFNAAFGGLATSVTVVGDFDFGLADGGELLRLFDADGLLVDYVAYDDEAPWPIEAAGGGPTLELALPGGDNALAANWSASAGYGTPGAANGSFADEVWLLDFVATSIEAGTSLEWHVLGEGDDFVLRARTPVDEWTVPYVFIADGYFGAVDPVSVGVIDDIIYSLYFVGSGGEERLLGSCTLPGPGAARAMLTSVGPNPTRGAVTITCLLEGDRHARLEVFDMAGRRVATLLDGSGRSGATVVPWTPRGLPAGVYFVSLESGGDRQTRKLVLLR